MEYVLRASHHMLTARSLVDAGDDCRLSADIPRVRYFHGAQLAWRWHDTLARMVAV